MSLLEIYYATQEVNQIKLFQIHQNANQSCPVGKHMEAAMSPILAHIETQLAEQLRQQTLADVISNLYREAKQSCKEE